MVSCWFIFLMLYLPLKIYVDLLIAFLFQPTKSLILPTSNAGCRWDCQTVRSSAGDGYFHFFATSLPETEVDWRRIISGPAYRWSLWNLTLQNKFTKISNKLTIWLLSPRHFLRLWIKFAMKFIANHSMNGNLNTKRACVQRAWAYWPFGPMNYTHPFTACNSCSLQQNSPPPPWKVYYYKKLKLNPHTCYQPNTIQTRQVVTCVQIHHTKSHCYPTVKNFH